MSDLRTLAVAVAATVLVCQALTWWQALPVALLAVATWTTGHPAGDPTDG